MSLEISSSVYESLSIDVSTLSINELRETGDRLLLPIDAGNQPIELLVLLAGLSPTVLVDESVPGRFAATTRPADVYLGGSYFPLHNLEDDAAADHMAAGSLLVSPQHAAALSEKSGGKFEQVFGGNVTDRTVSELHNTSLRELAPGSEIYNVTKKINSSLHLGRPLLINLIAEDERTTEVHDGRQRLAQGKAEDAEPIYYKVPSERQSGLVLSPAGVLALCLCEAHLTRPSVAIRVLANERMLRMSRDPERMAMIGRVVAKTMSDMKKPIKSSRITFTDVTEAGALVSSEQRATIRSQYDLLLAAKSRGDGISIPREMLDLPLGQAA